MKPVKCVCGDYAEVLRSSEGQCVICNYGCSSATPWMPTKPAAIRVWNAMQRAAKKEAKR